MNLQDIREFQKEFDRKHGWNWVQSEDFGEELKKMSDATVAFLGELGEFANVLKKLRRIYESDGKKESELIPSLKEELVDCFIYLIILANILDVDLENGYMEKMKVNEKRFERFRAEDG